VRLALDTNRYTDLCRGDASVVEAVELANEVWLPFIVLGELRAGFAVGNQGPRNEAVLRRFLLKSGVGVLYPMNRPLTITARFIGNCGSKALPSPPTICGSWLSSCSIRLYYAPAICILMRCPSCRAGRESIRTAAVESGATPTGERLKEVVRVPMLPQSRP
jgi:hypothetical protein